MISMISFWQEVRAHSSARKQCQSLSTLVLNLEFSDHGQEGGSRNFNLLPEDTQAMQLCLPADKYHRIIEELKKWHTRKDCTKRELLSLIGLLQHSSFIVKPGCTFLTYKLIVIPNPRSCVCSSKLARLIHLEKAPQFTLKQLTMIYALLPPCLPTWQLDLICLDHYLILVMVVHLLVLAWCLTCTTL